MIEMFDYDKVDDDMHRFFGENKSGYTFDVRLAYASLIESRMTNDLLFLNNPSLCSTLDLDVEKLTDELKTLTSLRENISFSREENKKIK